MPKSHDEVISGYGPITVVSNFMPGVDRLLLDFHTLPAQPMVTFDMGLELGSTAVMCNGRLMVILRDVTGVSTHDVELRRLPSPADWGPDGKVQLIENFNREKDVIEVLYDPQAGKPPKLSIIDFEDGTGATVLFDDKPILAVRGAQGLSADDVVALPRKTP